MDAGFALEKRVLAVIEREGLLQRGSRIVVADFLNETGRAVLDPLGVLASDVVTAALSQADGLTVINAEVVLGSRQRSPTLAAYSLLERQSLALVRQTRAGVIVTGSYFAAGQDLAVIAELCDRVTVMYAGEVVESGPVGALFHNPGHPYTQALLRCDPARIEERTAELPTIPGDVPNLLARPVGCVFADRCPAAIDLCRRTIPAPVSLGPDHQARCIRIGHAAAA